MKQVFPFITLWLSAVLPVAAAGPVAPNVSREPPAVQLSGISRLAKLNYACFVLNQPSVAVPHDFMLAEGETRFGIRLLAVDATSGYVQIENCGRKQSLHIRSTPTLVSRPFGFGATGHTVKPGAGGGNGPVNGNYSGSADPDGSANEATPDNLAWSGGGLAKNGNNAYPTSDQNSSSDQNTDPGQNSDGNSNPVGLDPAVALKDQSDTEWYQESAAIERNRLETAASVLAGETAPWPRTPLTPAGTPNNLIGDEVFFASHMPGFLTSDFSHVN